MDEFKNILEPERLPCMTKLWRPVIPNKKDRYLTPDELKLYVLQSPTISAVIEEISENDKVKAKKLKQNVKDMLNEIGLARSLPVIRWLGICLNKIFQRICTAVYVNEKSIERVKNVIGDRPVLYLPSHRSYADFVLMSYICFAYDLEIPGIAAGMDFHAMVGMGTVLRKTGAFFMRRSFSTDKLYWYVFKEYMRALVNVYHIGIEFFIEGTRSRSCKALMPKIGLLSMALEPYLMGEVPDIIIVPVGVAYEKPLEEQLFAYELLGIPKPKESTMGFLKALQILDSNYGSMYVNFGTPISVSEYLKSQNISRFEHAQMPAHVQHLTKSELGLINKLAHNIISCQQNLIVISTFNLISIYFNYRINIGKTTSLDEMCNGIILLADILKTLGALVTIEKHNVKSKILDSLITHSNILQIGINDRLELVKSEILNLQNVNKNNLKGYDLSENTIRNSIPTFSLQLYSNPCQYWLARPAIMILALRKLTKNGLINISSDKLKSEVRYISNIFENEFVLDQYEWENNFKSTLLFLNNYNILSINDYEISQKNNENSLIFLSSIAPFLCCYYNVAETLLLEFVENQNFTERDLLVKVQQRIENGLNEKKSLVHPYCLSLDSISVALQSFYGIQIVNKHKSNSSTTNVCYSVNIKSLTLLKNTLEEYSSLMPFNYLSNYLLFAKL